ncbi:caspase domain-containing protein [Lactarius hatsudake]|nr:caspase domain-containing protein [Lactarius hatsudake]
MRGRSGLIFPKRPLPGDDDRISRPLPHNHNPTSDIPISIRLPTHISRSFRWIFGLLRTGQPIRLPDDEEDKKEGPTSKRRALLVGISYKGDHNTWPALDGPHEDVDRFQQLLIETYEYRLEDITVLKDSPNLPDILHPTRVNMIRELKRLVSDAAPGDTFVFLYSGHSDQKLAIEDSEEEDSQNDMIITSDEQFILDNELNDILILLPIGCSLLAILDTYHSGTLLDLPHHHCNSVYVPWQSKGTRRTLTMQNNNGLHPHSPPIRWANVPLVRRQATDFTKSRSPDQALFPSQPRSASSELLFVCDGWCDWDDNPYPTVVSLTCSCPVSGRCGLMSLGSSLYLPARTCSVHGRAQTAHSPRSCAII